MVRCWQTWSPKEHEKHQTLNYIYNRSYTLDFSRRLATDSDSHPIQRAEQNAARNTNAGWTHKSENRFWVWKHTVRALLLHIHPRVHSAAYSEQLQRVSKLESTPDTGPLHKHNKIKSTGPRRVSGHTKNSLGWFNQRPFSKRTWEALQHQRPGQFQNISRRTQGRSVLSELRFFVSRILGEQNIFINHEIQCTKHAYTKKNKVWNK